VASALSLKPTAMSGNCNPILNGCCMPAWVGARFQYFARHLRFSDIICCRAIFWDGREMSAEPEAQNKAHLQLNSYTRRNCSIEKEDLIQLKLFG
jgi:hypothetical protein